MNQPWCIAAIAMRNSVSKRHPVWIINNLELFRAIFCNGKYIMQRNARSTKIGFMLPGVSWNSPIASLMYLYVTIRHAHSFTGSLLFLPNMAVSDGIYFPDLRCVHNYSQVNNAYKIIGFEISEVFDKSGWCTIHLLFVLFVFMPWPSTLLSGYK